MKFVDEYRRSDDARRIATRIGRVVRSPWTLMEVCGGQTHAIVRFGLDQMLPDLVTLVHGPGCPVCVTPIEMIDRSIAIAQRPEVILCSFGDMVRVPGSSQDLMAAKADGADVRMVYSPLDAVSLARANPDREVVFFAVGFETTAPANAGAVEMARELGLQNFSILASHVLVPPAIEAVLSAPDCAVRAFLAAGHVCTITGCDEYEPISQRYGVPIVVTGFEPLDILQGVLMCVEQLEAGTCSVQNQYARSVRAHGNQAAMTMVSRVFEVTDRKWRGIGLIPSSGLRLRDEYAAFDAERKFEVQTIEAEESPDCISGLVLQGLKRPTDCAAFGVTCTPERPLGATMVSSEGACAAYYQYRRRPTPS
ncbi:MAG: hydrogenase formation protein HypD [Armatimonadetes bacterium]|nr:hydrogenase formation protein HypD [Armatimonadota bacterium]